MNFVPNYAANSDMPSNINDLPPDEAGRLVEERVRLLHIYSQSQWHAPARIVGNQNALTVLRDAIDAALVNGITETHAMTADGEGYALIIEPDHMPWEHPSWETRPLPYTAAHAMGEPDLNYEITLWKIALKKANAGLVKRGVKPIPEPE